ncbi:short-chain dehydrogenase, partial [Bacillus cereus]
MNYIIISITRKQNDDFTSQKNYEDYTPEKYHCISVDDDII